MKNKRTWVFVILAAILLLINGSIYQKEQHLAHGATVCLRLAPVDPRSLMQGDYMRLRFSLADTLRAHIPATERWRNHDGRVLLNVEANCSASFAGLLIGQKLRPKQIILHYRLRNGHIKIASNAFFFQEGTAKRYAKAAYGVFKINANGDPLLVRLKDAQLQDLGGR